MGGIVAAPGARRRKGLAPRVVPDKILGNDREIDPEGWICGFLRELAELA
jgi:hypothetical protein